KLLLVHCNILHPDRNLQHEIRNLEYRDSASNRGCFCMSFAKVIRFQLFPVFAEIAYPNLVFQLQG
ncbi:unnamed protein product, partial [Prunus brigantina]